uniref:Mitochondrial import inner membrane translocase subunit tim9 n=1 Tax=Ascaris lumbricoides TaxID=6252 RepID=A0A0M3IEF7_ASCLU
MAANPKENVENADGAMSVGDMYAGTTSEPLHKESDLESTRATTPDDEFTEKKPKKSVIVDPKKKIPELTTFDRRNFLLHQYYIQRDFSSCKALIKEMLDESKGMNEYAAYVRGKIARMEGNLRESLEW